MTKRTLDQLRQLSEKDQLAAAIAFLIGVVKPLGYDKKDVIKLIDEAWDKCP